MQKRLSENVNENFFTCCANFCTDKQGKKHKNQQTAHKARKTKTNKKTVPAKTHPKILARSKQTKRPPLP